jgi:hypothetical protein
MAFEVQPDGSLKNPRVFAMSGGDGLAVDNAGRLYSAVAAAMGIRVFNPRGELLGTIPAGVPPAGKRRRPDIRRCPADMLMLSRPTRDEVRSGFERTYADPIPSAGQIPVAVLSVEIHAVVVVLQL